MILRDLYLLRRHQPVPITAEERATLAREGARGFGNATTRGLRRARGRLQSQLYTFALLVACAWRLHWPAQVLLGFVLVSVAVTVIVDALRIRLAGRWLEYSHTREHRTNELLIVARSLERGSATRPPQPPLWGPRTILLAAAAATAVGLLGAWLLLHRFGGLGWAPLFAHKWLPLILAATILWRLARGLREVVVAKRAAVGFHDVFLDSDDALDTYALTVLIALPLFALGGGAALAAVFLIVLLRLAYRAYRYWWYRQSLQVLSQWVARPSSRQQEPPG